MSLQSPIFLEDYCKSMLVRFETEEELTNFLNQADLARKFDADDIENLIGLWLTEKGYIEADPAELNLDFEPDVTISITADTKE